VAAETYTTPTSAPPNSAPTAGPGGPASGKFTLAAAVRTGSANWRVRAARVAAASQAAAAGSEPRLRQLIGVCGWAAVLGGVGLIIGIRGFWGVLVGGAPAWYEPALVLAGGLGLAFTCGGFLTAQHRYAPWISLGIASLILSAAIVLTSLAF
jgi:hypothetical protein